MRRLVKSKKILRNQNHNELYTTPSLTGGCCIFYTDFHHVDEDLIAMTAYGGHWGYGNQAGVMCRNMIDTPTHMSNIVASKCQHLHS